MIYVGCQIQVTDPGRHKNKTGTVIKQDKIGVTVILEDKYNTYAQIAMGGFELLFPKEDVKLRWLMNT